MINVQKAFPLFALLIPIALLLSAHDLAARGVPMPEPSGVPQITVVTVTPEVFGPGETIDVFFTTTGAFNPGNVFTAQMSNMVGDFTNARMVGSWPSTSQGAITVRLPCELGSGSGFRIRVVSSSPYVVGPDNGIALTLRARPVFEVTASGPTIFCPGGSVVLTATPGFLSYHWNTNETTRSIVARGDGIYTVYAWDENECGLVSRATVTVHIPPKPPIRLRNGVVLETDFGYVSYQWKLDSIPIPDSNWPTLKVDDRDGVYTVTVTDTNGCAGTSPPKQIPVPASAPGELRHAAEVHVSAERDRLTVETELSGEERVAIAVSDVAGREVLRREDTRASGRYHREVEIGALPAGAYLVRVMVGTRVVVEKVRVEGR